MNETTDKKFPGLQAILFDAPLYDEYLRPETDEEKASISSKPLDGHCPFCGASSMFNVKIERNTWIVHSAATDDVVLKCVREDKHQLRFVVMFRSRSLQKIGQFPPYATIAQSELKGGRKYLSEIDGRELHTAIGLAAHGVGIGSFVYVRRIFERIIRQRFDEYKAAEKWSEQDFDKLRMNEKIQLLKNHLPDFMVKNQRLYSILSQGIHELDEKSCIAFFEVARTSITLILDEDRRKKEELAERKAAENAIAAFAAASPATE
jgi:hypothetical protein